MATGLFYGHQYLLVGMLVLLLPFIPGSKYGSKYLLPHKKLISNTVLDHILFFKSTIRVEEFRIQTSKQEFMRVNITIFSEKRQGTFI